MQHFMSQKVLEHKVFPGLLAADRHEVSLPNPALLQRHRAWRANERWRGSFNVAAWLRFPEGLVEMVQLMLGFRDKECGPMQCKTYLIDRCLPNQQTLILLNGIVDLDVTGEASDLILYLTGLSEDAVWILDECHIEPRQSVALDYKGMRSQRS
jgi:hypothetical protein